MASPRALEGFLVHGRGIWVEGLRREDGRGTKRKGARGKLQFFGNHRRGCRYPYRLDSSRTLMVCSSTFAFKEEQEQQDMI